MLSLETYGLIIIILSFIGGICITGLYYQKIILKLRLRIIIQEHDLAILEKRIPRPINEVLESPLFPNKD